jgi:Na+/H+ antiporter NhaC
MEHGVLSLLPALLAIVLAVLTRNVILSLFSAVAVAGILHRRALVGGVVHALDETVVGAIADTDHAKTMLFTVLMGAMVGVLGKSGATRSVVEALARRARSPRAVQLLTWLSGLVVFFDDYANCMIVGNAMRPLGDRFGITRAKLAYIVDSTAAPVASLALVSTWVGFEVSQIEKGLEVAKGAVSGGEAYGLFVEGWPYRFYPILAILFVGMVAYSGRDFAAMRSDRSRAAAPAEGADPEEPLGKAPWWLAASAIVVLIGVTLLSLWLTGRAEWQPDQPLFELLANADGYGSIVYGSFSALLLAVVLARLTRALDLPQATEAALGGMRLMFEALVILVLAWSLSTAMKDLGAPQYLVSVLRTALPVPLLPTITFLVGAGISFAVGSSYATMGIMMPIVIPLAYELAPGDSVALLASSGSVLAGACFGDHCSPISDTTVLSSIGAGADHLAHVRTQLPYALWIGGISVVLGTLPVGYGVDPWLCLALGLVASALVLRFVAKPGSAASPPPQDAEAEGG